MKKFDELNYTLLGIMLLCLIGIASVYFWGSDNPVEEISEELIEASTGEEIDLTPNSPEGDMHVNTKNQAP